MGIIQGTDRKDYDGYHVIEAFRAEGKEISVGKSVFEKGGRIPKEGFAAHEEDEYVYVIKGDISFGVEGEKYCLHEGDFHYMPRGSAHWCRNEADEESELFYILVKP